MRNLVTYEQTSIKNSETDKDSYLKLILESRAEMATNQNLRQEAIMKVGHVIEQKNTLDSTMFAVEHHRT